MKAISCSLSLMLLFTMACGSPNSDQTSTESDSSPGAQSRDAMAADHEMGLNREIHVDETITNAWRAVRVAVRQIEGGRTDEYTVDLGQSIDLGDTGMVLDAKVFIPDFVMDEDGIASASPKPNNPAVQVVIHDDSGTDYEGWLFAKTPEIHPYQNPDYAVTLLEGVGVNEE